MKLPGLAWLELSVDQAPDGRTVYHQRAIFQPRGLAGHAYWRSIWRPGGPRDLPGAGRLCRTGVYRGMGTCLPAGCEAGPVGDGGGLYPAGDAEFGQDVRQALVHARRIAGTWAGT